MKRPKNCPSCGGELCAANIGWKCKSCKGIVDMRGEFHEHIERSFMPSKSNFDCMRAMNAKEVAKLFVDAVADGCPPKMDWDCCKDTYGWDGCEACWEKWLLAKGDDTE